MLIRTNVIPNKADDNIHRQPNVTCRKKSFFINKDTNEL